MADPFHASLVDESLRPDFQSFPPGRSREPCARIVTVSGVGSGAFFGHLRVGGNLIPGLTAIAHDPIEAIVSLVD
jgi:hypothetical protein